MTNSVRPEKTLLVIGLGMIGGSLLRAVHEAGGADNFLGFDSNPDCVEQARSAGLVANSAAPLAELAAQASIIAIAAPPLVFDTLFKDLAAAPLADDVVITDVASVKQPVLEACRRNAPSLLARFLPAHPIAGSEKSGLAHSRVELFAGKKLILTPHDAVDEDAYKRVNSFWARLNCTLAELEPVLHDELLASTSHLPHVLAYVLVDSLLGHSQIDRLFEFAAGGFQDISRTASSDPTMWHDIFVSNKQFVLQAVEDFERRLSLFRELLEQDRGAELYDMLHAAKKGRDDYLEKYRS